MGALLQVWRNMFAEHHRVNNQAVYEGNENMVQALGARLTSMAIECTLKHDFLKATHALPLE